MSVGIKNERNIFLIENGHFHFADKATAWRLLGRGDVYDMGAAESILGWVVRGMQIVITKAHQGFNGKSS